MIRNQFGGQEYLIALGSTIMEYARTYGVFTHEQAYLMLPDKHYTTIDKVLKGLVTERNLFLRGERYYIANPRAEIDYTMINCLWVLLEIKENALPESNGFWLGKAKKPALISYVKNNVLYDIVPIAQGGESIITYIENQYKLELERQPESKHKFIIVVPKEEMIDMLPAIAAQHIFALVNELPYENMNYETKKLVTIKYFEGNE